MDEHSILGCGSYRDDVHGIVIPWYDRREPWLVRHEVFHGANRQTSIRYGCYVFLTPEAHNMSSYGVHFNRPFELHLQRVSQVRAMKHYGWSMEDWYDIFGRSYL